MPVFHVTSTGSTSVIIDMNGYESVVFALQIGSSGSTDVPMHVESGSSSGGGDMVDMTGTSITSSGANTMIVTDFINPPYRYVRPVVLPVSQSVFGVLAIQYGARVLPTTQSSDVTASEVNVGTSGTI